jgi:hypothetical protein
MWRAASAAGFLEFDMLLFDFFFLVVVNVASFVLNSVIGIPIGIVKAALGLP